MITATELEAALTKKYPVNATCWSQATDEVRDMSRWAREVRSLDEDAAVQFRAIIEPSEWNRRGIASIVSHFSKMTDYQKGVFLGLAEGMF